MTEKNATGANPRCRETNETNVLLFSMRQSVDLVASCAIYEFEDIVQAVTTVERVDVTNSDRLEFSRRAYKYARRYSRSKTLAARIAPAPHLIRLQRDYDFFFPIFNHPHELYALAAIPDWRKHCRVAACYIVELWSHLLPEYLLELLADFDCIFVGSRNVTAEVARMTGKPCFYLPMAVDIFKFTPDPESPARTIDVCNIGRRSPITHGALLDWARRRRGKFYYYDTVAASGVDAKQRTFHVDNASEHRFLYASLLRRTRYFIANRARANEPQFTESGDEISSRFYEGAAAGTILIGDPPHLQEFHTQFDWPDAVIPLPFDAPQIVDLLAELDADSERVVRIRRDNIYHAALRHDWVYRLRQVFDQLKLEPTPSMLMREQQLHALAAQTRMPRHRNEHTDSAASSEHARSTAEYQGQQTVLCDLYDSA